MSTLPDKPSDLNVSVCRRSDGSLVVAHVVDADLCAVAQMMGRDGDLDLARQFACAPDMLSVLKTTAGNIRSLGAAGALGVLPEPYTVWLATVEEAIARAEGRAPQAAADLEGAGL